MRHFLLGDNSNQSGTRREHPKSALYLRLKKRKDFMICSGRFLQEKYQFRNSVRVAQKFGYSVLKQM